ncbi:cell wall-binding protein [Clostridium beijerinckii]|uniref:Cell wall-binding protein n=1 Tax=Clostridium beijerinckii TaxID=1520 RepID=A0A0B5QIR8_CLOBE|nr:N-acetylmuramoyl-L-alanine amidase family protein [Clostridium beijerinckii]AJG97832.1 cell wall-binding protein [Clostridium beijerinckii]
MKSLKLRKIVASVVAALTIATLSPIGASAEWKQDSNGWWNTEGNSYSTGWRSIDGNWYYFDSTGYMKTGWANDGGTWYYLNPVSDGTKGAMKAGWIKDNGTWYYLNPVSDGTKGAMKTGWINDNGVWYFASTSGAMQTGVIEVNGKVYYLAANGAMATGNVTINGVVYTFAASGEAIGDKKPTPTLAFTSAGVPVKVSDPSDTTGTTIPTTTTGGGGGSHHSSGGSTVDSQQSAIDNKYAQEAVIPKITPVPSDDGKTATISVASVLAPAFIAELGQEKPDTIDGIEYLVKKDITISTADGTDVGITQNGLAEYTVKAGTKGTVTAVISLLNTKTGQLYYVSSSATTFQA